MDGQDWGGLIGIVLGDGLVFGFCTIAAVVLLTRTRLAASKVMIAALFLGHVAARIILHNGSQGRWTALGLAVSRAIWIPLLWIYGVRRIRRWRIEDGAAGMIPGQSETPTSEPRADTREEGG